jgi:Tfp pilus assembly protein PilZ
MKTVLDLIAEFAALNDAKVRSSGRLDPDEERRFTELKGFYDLLMAHTGLASRRVTRRFSAEDVLSKVKARERLRVPLETEMIFSVGGELHAGLAVNLSRGGLFLSTRQVVPVDSPVTIYLSSPDTIDHALIETPAKVVWVTERGLSASLLPPGMGVSFVAKRGLVETYLDAMVVDSLVRHLSGMDANSLAPEFIGRELVEI